MKKLLVLLGAIALTFTLASAVEGKCESGKCNGDMKKMEKKADGAKCGATHKKETAGKCSADKKEKKEAPAKGKCG